MYKVETNCICYLGWFCILVAACCVCCCRFGVKCCGVPLSQIFGGWNNLGKKSSNYSKLTGKEDTSGGGEIYVPPRIEVIAGDDVTVDSKY